MLDGAVTLGFVATMLNGLQAVCSVVRASQKPDCDALLLYSNADNPSDFNNPVGATLGILRAVLPLGACCATPSISKVGDRFVGARALSRARPSCSSEPSSRSFCPL